MDFGLRLTAGSKDGDGRLNCYPFLCSPGELVYKDELTCPWLQNGDDERMFPPTPDLLGDQIETGDSLVEGTLKIFVHEYNIKDAHSAQQSSKFNEIPPTDRNPIFFRRAEAKPKHFGFLL